MTRQWFYLDALPIPQGPFSDLELDRVLSRSDCLVFTEGLLGWRVASELCADGSAYPLDEAPARSHLDARPAPQPPLWCGAPGGPRSAKASGLARGMIRDGDVSPSEEALARWLDVNAYEAGVWPISAVAQRLERIYADGRIDAEKQAELRALLHAVNGKVPGTTVAMKRATRLPLDEPQPDLRFSGQTYVFTGKFAFGTRGRLPAGCESQRRAVRELGEPEDRRARHWRPRKRRLGPEFVRPQNRTSSALP